MMKINPNNVRTIRTYLTDSELIAQLGEECAELAQMCAKYSRIDTLNPPRIKPEEIDEGIIEEFSDICNVALVLGLEPNKEIQAAKLKRWSDNIYKELLCRELNEGLI